ncbi:MAG: glycosyltransferase [Patescibacteria group bacterium]|nr:glycosyltransferase [Patescibacteria group bacterium]
MNVALVHDDLIQEGGAERVFQALVELFPRAGVFTSMAVGDWMRRMVEEKSSHSPAPGAAAKEAPGASPAVVCESAGLQTSFMQRFPFKEKLYRAYFPFYPLAFESFDLSGYDLIVSSSSRFAHSVITRPEASHICYMHSPGREFWEPEVYFQEQPRLQKVLTPFLSWLRCWDFAASHRVDYFIANSKSTKNRIAKYYGREAKVIHPFVELDRFSLGWHGSGEVKKQWQHFCTKREIKECSPGFFLIVSRLISWKRIDIAVKACNKLKQPLIIVGEGPDKKRLEKMAGPTVHVLGRLSDEDVVNCFQACKALIFPQREDFGITPLEVMACGKPVLAYKSGGVLETVLPGKTGEFFYPQTVRVLADAISHFDARRFKPQVCRKQASIFSRKRFEDRFSDFVVRVTRSQK